MFSNEYRAYALRAILDIYADERIPPAAIEVWDRLNDRAINANTRFEKRIAAQRAHVVALEAKLGERRNEFSQMMAVAVIISKCRRYILACEIESQLFLPGTVALPGDTPGETFAAVAVGVGVVTDAPREIAVQRDVTENGLKLTRVYLGAFQAKEDNNTQPRQVQWFHIGDNRISENERSVINYLLSM